MLASWAGAISFFTAVPFGPQIGEFLAWRWFGGGRELLEEKFYAPHNVTSLVSFCIGPETSGWFKSEITDPAEQLKGLKMRFFGLGALVMQKMGVSTQLLSGADIFPALEKGVIDATEFSMPITDITYGFHQVATYNYFPGWHQQVSCSELLMNKEKYDALPESYKAMVTAAAREQVIWTYAETEATNPQAMMEMQSKARGRGEALGRRNPRHAGACMAGSHGRDRGRGAAVQGSRGQLPRVAGHLSHLG